MEKFVLYREEKYGSHYIFSGYDILISAQGNKLISAWRGLKRNSGYNNIVFFNSSNEAKIEKMKVIKNNEYTSQNDIIIKKYLDVEEVDLLSYLEKRGW